MKNISALSSRHTLKTFNLMPMKRIRQYPAAKPTPKKNMCEYNAMKQSRMQKKLILVQRKGRINSNIVESAAQKEN